MAQLKTGIWVDALIRRAQAGGAFACVVQRGDRDAGTVLVTVRDRDGLMLYQPERDMDGARVWRAEELDETALTQRVEQRLNFDSDLMVVEIDDATGRHFITEPVIEPDAAKAGPAPAPSDAPDRPEPMADAAAALAAAKAVFRDR